MSEEREANLNFYTFLSEDQTEFGVVIKSDSPVFLEALLTKSDLFTEAFVQVISEIVAKGEGLKTNVQ